MVSTMLLGVVCGQLFFGSLSDWLGRKWAFVATALLTVLSALAGRLKTRTRAPNHPLFQDKMSGHPLFMPFGFFPPLF